MYERGGISGNDGKGTVDAMERVVQDSEEMAEAF